MMFFSRIERKKIIELPRKNSVETNFRESLHVGESSDSVKDLTRETTEEVKQKENLLVVFFYNFILTLSVSYR